MESENPPPPFNVNDWLRISCRFNLIMFIFHILTFRPNVNDSLKKITSEIESTPTNDATINTPICGFGVSNYQISQWTYQSQGGVKQMYFVESPRCLSETGPPQVAHVSAFLRMRVFCFLWGSCDINFGVAHWGRLTQICDGNLTTIG